MYDLTSQRRGVSYPNFGPARIEEIARIVTKVSKLADVRIGFAALQNNKHHPLKRSHEGAAEQGLEIGPLIAKLTFLQVMLPKKNSWVVVAPTKELV